MTAKCGKCKKDFEPEMKKNGEPYRWCRPCLDRHAASVASSKCEHGKRRSRCRECKGGGICEHGKVRSECIPCEGGSICEHKRKRETCRQCKGSQICEHDRRRANCRKCKGKQICKHDRIRANCKKCKGCKICSHGKQRHQCIVCTPANACIKCKTVKIIDSTYKPYCFLCYCDLNPDFEPVNRRGFKERYFIQNLIENLTGAFEQDTIMFNKMCGESKRKPDTRLECLGYNIIVELDEEQHKVYQDEHIRMMDIFNDLDCKPMVAIRYNPDSYKDSENNFVAGCFLKTVSGYNVNRSEWVRRFCVLLETVEQYLLNPPTRDYTYIELFYDGSEI